MLYFSFVSIALIINKISSRCSNVVPWGAPRNRSHVIGFFVYCSEVFIILIKNTLQSILIAFCCYLIMAKLVFGNSVWPQVDGLAPIINFKVAPLAN
ncbi:MAG: hypothetical protein JWR38_4056 [Mucilaginibacter sp.]|nr:hypothetical protein [Mucilaginibacter sp.]